MEDFKTILYILAAVAYFIFNAWRKAFKEDKEKVNTLPDKKADNIEKPHPSRPIAPRTSFEDIMRELQPKLDKAQEQGRSVVAGAEPPATPVFSYEKAVKEPVSLETTPMRPSPARRKPILQPEVAAVYQKQNQANPYRELLRNPAGVRDAVILSEILNRKYS